MENDDPGFVGDLRGGLGLGEDDLAMLSFARRLTRAPETMAKAHVDALRAAGFFDEQILDIVIQVAYKNFTTRFCLALGVEVEERYQQYRDAFAPTTGPTGEPAAGVVEK
jgi:alkylhydroperoxidase family enzyme